MDSCRRLRAYSVITGEEEEETLLHIRGKLYALCPQNQWKERGTGQLKLNVRRADGSGARLGSCFLRARRHVLSRALLLSNAKRSCLHVAVKRTAIPGNEVFPGARPAIYTIQCYRRQQNRAL